MARLTTAFLLIVLPVPAMAAGNDVPLSFALPFYLMLYLVFSVPAAGMGFVIGSSLRPGRIVLLLSILGSTIPIGVWATYGPEKIPLLAAMLAFLLLVFS